MREQLRSEGVEGVSVISGGTLGIEGAPAAPEAVEALSRLEVDLRSHRSSGLTSEIVGQVDLVIAMARHHLEELAARFPEGTTDRQLVLAFDAGADPDPYAEDLPDPIGKSERLYHEQAAILRRCVRHLVEHVRRGLA